MFGKFKHHFDNDEDSKPLFMSLFKSRESKEEENNASNLRKNFGIFSLGNNSLFRTPRTKPVNFSSWFPLATSEEKTILKEAQLARNRLEQALNNNREPEFIVLAIQGYLRYLPDLSIMVDAREKRDLERMSYEWKSNFALEERFFEEKYHSFEIAMVLMTLGIMKLRMANEKFGSSSEVEVNEASHHLSEAAGIFQFLRNSVLPDCILDVGRGSPPDVHPISADLFYSLALGQSQQLILRRGELKGMSDGTLLKVALGVLEYYEAAEKQAGSIRGCAKPSEYLTKLAKYSSIVLKATCYYYMGKQAHSDGKHGLKVACLRASLETLSKERLKKINSKFRFDTLKQLANSTFQNSTSLFEEYYRQNTSVYYEREPEVGELVFLAGRSLVKIVPFALPESGIDRDSIAKRLELLKRNSVKESNSPQRLDSQTFSDSDLEQKENNPASTGDKSLSQDRYRENDLESPSAPSQME
ncbi:hypothetical protein GpartN1_g1958.t1 [Galdieria partita]|uniref:BRO1 domain-containing protein n=1 Tax=Galdieria partita TaxID=83374 RepID=A0A9C7PV38_9RHOD|nr:hypothetical protein GpartN1_g1958.t1 [Galdieria partita]